MTRRSKATVSKDIVSGILAADGLVVNEELHTVVLDGEPLDLTALEFAILVTLMRAKGRVKTRE